MVFGSPLTLATYVCVVVTGCTFQFISYDQFSLFFQNFPNFHLGVRFASEASEGIFSRVGHEC